MMHQALAGLDRLHHRTVRSVETSALITIAAAFAYDERDRIREQVALVKVDQGIRGRYLGGRARSAGRPRPTVNSSRILRSKPPSGGWSSFGLRGAAIAPSRRPSGRTGLASTTRVCGRRSPARPLAYPYMPAGRSGTLWRAAKADERPKKHRRNLPIAIG
jgi:hypothetical protein